MSDFSYMRLVCPKPLACVYICFGDAPHDLANSMLRALSYGIQNWPPRNFNEWYFEANPEAIIQLMNDRILKMNGEFIWSVGGGEATFYGASVREVYPVVLEPTTDDPAPDLSVLTREIARGG